MKAISIRPDYAFEILVEKKKREYRSWAPSHRGDLLICSTQQKIQGTIPGHALAVCTLESVEKLSSGGYAWNLTNLRTIKPFPVKGRQHLFNVDDDLIIYSDLDDASDTKEVNDFVQTNILPLIV